MTEPTAAAKLEEASQGFEAQLEKPVVPGDLADWTRAMAEGCTHLTEVLRATIESEHAARYAAIEQQDPGLLHRIQQMREADRFLLESAVELGVQTSLLARDAAQAEPREADLEDLRAETARRALDLVIRIRTQQSALATWYAEAFYRDRGTGD